MTVPQKDIHVIFHAYYQPPYPFLKDNVLKNDKVFLLAGLVQYEKAAETTALFFNSSMR